MDAVQREQRLSQLRELALVLAADVVDHQLTEYLQRHGIDAALRHARAHSGVHYAARQCAGDDGDGAQHRREDSMAS